MSYVTADINRLTLYVIRSVCQSQSACHSVVIGRTLRTRTGSSHEELLALISRVIELLADC